MLISKSLMFVHYPRTGGSSVRKLLSTALPDTYYPMSDMKLNREQKVWITHQGLDVCHKYAKQQGLDPYNIPTLVCIRNPYSLMLSEFMYLRQKWKKKIADLESTLPEYLVSLTEKTTQQRKQKWASDQYGRYHDYLMVNGEQPANLTIARFESLQSDVSVFMKDLLGVEKALKFPHKNASRHREFSNYYTAKEEELVYQMWKNVFDSGLYKRYEGLNL